MSSYMKQDKEIGKKYGRLTVIKRATEDEYPRGNGCHKVYYCKCDCGNYTFALGTQLRNGKRVSCGCLSREKAVNLAKQLGEKNRPNLISQQFGDLKVVELYSTNPTKWLCECKCGAKTIVETANLRNGHTMSCGCRKQKMASKGEDLIVKILKKENIEFIKEKSFLDLKGFYKKPLRFDFAIYKNSELKFLIEYQGEQHYKEIPILHSTRQDFLQQQEYDRKKIRYCLANNIKLYIIPFFEHNNIKTYKDLIQDKFLATSQWHNDIVYREYLNNK